jgi:two-component system, OmpR family, sensor histidine kinase CiaH
MPDSHPTHASAQERQLLAERRRLALRFAAGLAVALSVLLLAGYLTHSALVTRALKKELQSLAQIEADMHRADLQRWASAPPPPAAVTIGERPHRTFFYYILSPTGTLLYGNENTPLLRDAALGLLAGETLHPGEVVFRPVRSSAGNTFRLALLRHPVEQDGRYLGSIYAGTDVGTSLAHLDQLLRVTAALALALVVLSTLAGWMIADRALTPLRQALLRQHRFTADAAHELRGPLAVLNTALALLDAEAGARLDSFQHQTLRDARAETDRLRRITQDLLLLARADQASLPPPTEAVALAPLIERQLRLRTAQLAEKELTLSHTLAPEACTPGDPDLLTRMLCAGLDNAIAYTPAGGQIGVELACRGNAVEITIADSGPGMSADECSHAFERFYRADQARRRSAEGAGLGLALVQEIVRAHHGDAELDSAPGRGTRLHIRLPQAAAPAVLPDSAPPRADAAGHSPAHG